MIDTTIQVLSAREAARIIYNSGQPTDEEVNQVRAKLARGQLKGSPKGRWTTTTQAVAEYMSSQAAGAKLAAAGGARRSPPVSGPLRNEDAKLGSFYHQLLKDYFLAVTLRRRTGHRSRGFSRMVLAGQIALLLVSVALLTGGVRAVLAVTTTPEQRAVAEWLSVNAGEHKVTEWFPAQSTDAGTVVPVRYQYIENKKPIETIRQFLVRQGSVTPVFAADSAED